MDRVPGCVPGLLIDRSRQTGDRQLLTARGIGNKVSYDVAVFIYQRIAAKKSDFKWTERQSPLATSE